MFEPLFLRYPFFRYIPSILCFALIFKFSAMPNDELDFMEGLSDKLLHGLAYFCTAIACSFWTRLEVFRAKPWFGFLLGFLLATLYGATDEFHQSFVPGRSCELADFLADAVGAFLGAALYLLVLRLFFWQAKAKGE